MTIPVREHWSLETSVECLTLGFGPQDCCIVLWSLAGEVKQFVSEHRTVLENGREKVVSVNSCPDPREIETRYRKESDCWGCRRAVLYVPCPWKGRLSDANCSF